MNSASQISTVLDKEKGSDVYGSVFLQVEGYVSDMKKSVKGIECIDSACCVNGFMGEEIFSLLTSRKFSYMTRRHSDLYKDKTIPLITQYTDQEEPIKFYYDFGPGYHASIDPQNHELSFEVGLSEIFAIRQMLMFCEKIKHVYKAGAKFFIIIDNLCAYITNDIPLQLTNNYVMQLRALIDEVKANDSISVLVESELFSLGEYLSLYQKQKNRLVSKQLSQLEVDNVTRFLGRECCINEATKRVARYKRAGTVTELLLSKLVDGVRLTQRATSETLAFRSFPGGDQRIQVGRMALTMNHKRRIVPLLVTSRNYNNYRLSELVLDGIPSQTVITVLYAAPL
ncbi:L-tyrosine/L-tryptophan isonitrile synthase family protein [Desulfosediminicola ganghwensis]|uniref:L-tyrosine/L-tryptophan isonitrile synthase family protein n=1 Tax=Desulfosediminicola ganghwensis TaxID=2569540 RepID=UPI0010AC1295|nr:L-tyrosine/L-tryptophan isonitrile synthase family protein [Desulfosediminicola ganghwensis]